MASTPHYSPVCHDGQEPKLDVTPHSQPDGPKAVLLRTHHPDGSHTPSRTPLSPTVSTRSPDKGDLSYPPCPSTSVGGLPAESAYIAEVFLFSSPNYKILAAFALWPDLLATEVAVLDTGAGPNCVHLDALPPGAQDHIRAGPLPAVHGANNQQLPTVGIISLYTQAGTAIVKTDFVVCRDLSVPLILGTAFINRNVRHIDIVNQRVLMLNGSHTPILRRCRHINRRLQPLEPSRPKEPTQPLPQRKDSHTVRVAKHQVLPPHSQSWVSVNTSQNGLFILEAKAQLAERRNIAAANGLVDVRAGVPFKVLVGNFTDKPQQVPRRMILGALQTQPIQATPTRLSVSDVLGIPQEDQADILGSAVHYENQSGMPDGPTTVNIAGDRRFTELRPDTAQNATTATTAPMTTDNIDLAQVPDHLRARARAVLKRHEQLWSGHLGEIHEAKHYIDLTPGARPFRSQPYRAGPKQRELEAAEIRRMLAANVIRPSKSQWASPVLLVPKPDGSMRFCIDYRRLNALTVRDHYPIPRMDECLDSLGTAKVFSTLDANSGYWQMAVAEDSIDKTAFVSHSGFYEWTRMPFGLTNAPATFQRALDLILAGYKWHTCLVYLDDIIIFSNSVSDHIEHLNDVLTALGQAGISLKLPKCSFFTDTVKYLGHRIRPGTLEIEMALSKSLRQLRPPPHTHRTTIVLGPM